MHVSSPSRNLFVCFIFSLPNQQCMLSENYKTIASVKNGLAIRGKYKSKKLIFKIPNRHIVFANNEPDISKLSKDRWKIFEI